MNDCEKEKAQGDRLQKKRNIKNKYNNDERRKERNRE